MISEGKKNYPFERTCPNIDHAKFVIKRIYEQYSSDEKWEIGEPKIEQLPNGEVKVYFDLFFDETKRNGKSR